MNNLWLYALIALVGLTVFLVILYTLNRKNNAVGGGTGYICGVLANILVNLEKRMEWGSVYFHNACSSLLQELNSSGKGNVNVALRLCFYCALGFLIFLGEVVGVMTVLHAMSPTMPDIASSGLAEFAQAALFLCTPALFGDILLTVCKIQKSGLIRGDLGILARIILGFVALALLIFSIAVNSYFYMYRGLLLSSSLADHITAQKMIPYVLTGLGLEVSSVSPFALMAIFETGGLLPVLAWGASMVCKIIAAIASFLPRILNVVSTRLGGETVYKEHGIVIDSTTFVRVNRVVIDNLKTQLLTSKLATNILTDSSIVTSVDGDDIQTAFPDPSLNGLNGRNEHIDLVLDIDQLPVPGKNGDTETSNVEKETSNTKTSDDTQKKSKPGVRRSLKLFDYQKEYLPTAEQSDHKVSAEKTVKQTTSTRKRKTPVKPAASRSRQNKTTKTQASTKAATNAAK
jgi:hypothetical protein